MGPTDPTDPQEEPAKGPLSGILVADFARILAGPYATMMLGDLGAQVIKVESPAGDDTREWVPPRRDGVGTYYLGVNRNKRSIALDLSDAHDQAVAHALAQRADVFIQNFRPGGLAQFGLDYDSVARRNSPIADRASALRVIAPTTATAQAPARIASRARAAAVSHSCPSS